METSAIFEEINRLRRRIMELEDSIDQYQKMNKKINEGTEKLNYASSYVKESYIGLDNNYDSQIAKQKVNELKNEFDSINNITNRFTQILIESNNKINQIRLEKQRINRDIISLIQMMLNMGDKV